MALTILGSTGSIGRQALEVAEDLGLPVCALAAGRSAELLEAQVRRFHPKYAVLGDETAAKALRIALADTETKVLSGPEALLEIARMPEADTVLGAMSGAAGLRPALAAAEAGKRLALANKETLVCAGRILLAAVDRCGAELIPVDSEHSAIFQCLNGNPEPKRILLTASGGPFRDFTAEQLAEAARNDKKASQRAIDFIVPRGIGTCDIVRIDIADLQEWIETGLAW